jgi:hypothetical protein
VLECESKASPVSGGSIGSLQRRRSFGTAGMRYDPADVLHGLNQLAGQAFHHAVIPAGAASETIRIFTRFSPGMLLPLHDGPRFTIRHLSIPGQASVIFAAVHFPSKLYSSDDSQAIECTALARAIAEVEAGAGHDRTVLVGDLNMNPFESGMVGAAGLNATMVRERASKDFRTVQGRFFIIRCGATLGTATEGRQAHTIVTPVST